MGCCSSCLEAVRGSQDDSPSETEMQGTAVAAISNAKSLTISRAMSAPSIDAHGDAVTGHGIAIVGVSVEQDSAYWEAHIDLGDGAEPVEVMFGVSLKKDRSFFKALENVPAVQQAEKGTEFMRKIKVKRGDTVGIAVQQDDLPMIQFLLNGEPFHNLSINKFRGTVYPSVFLPEYESLLVKLVFDESKFKEMTPGARFGPLIVARGII